jgi:hypothetical protein
MTLRTSIQGMLLAAVLVAAMPVRSSHAAEAAGPVGAAATPAPAAKDTSAYAPRLIDPQSPPPGEQAQGTVASTPAADAPAVAATATKASESGDDVLNRPRGG